MLRRHHCVQVTSNGITQKVDDDDGPSAKRRKISDLIETPKVTPPGVDRLSQTSHSEPRPSNSRQTVVQSPTPGTSQSTRSVRPHRSSPLRRYNSTPDQLILRSHAANGVVVNNSNSNFANNGGNVSDGTRHHLAMNAGSHIQMPPMASSMQQASRHVPSQQQNIISANHPVPATGLPSPNGQTSHGPQQFSSRQPPVLTALPQPSPYFTSSSLGPLHTAGYFPFPFTPMPTSASANIDHMGCYLPCLPAIPAVPASETYLAAIASAHPWPTFSTIGVVPSPMLATEALPGYFGVQRHQVPMYANAGVSAGSSTQYQQHHGVHVMQQQQAQQTAAPTMLPHADFTMPQTRSVESRSSAAYQQHSSQHAGPSSSSSSRAPPPYPSSSSAARHHQQPQPSAGHYHHHHAHHQRSPSTVQQNEYPTRYVANWTTPADTDHTQPPLFVQQFLSMLESTLGAVHNTTLLRPYPGPTFHNYEALLGLARQLSESKPKGMSKADIDRLPSYQYTTACGSGAAAVPGDSKEKEASTEVQTTCVVCMCDFASRQRVRELPCQHIYHTKCIDKWLKTNRTCPLCRADALDLLGLDAKAFIE